MPFSNSFVPVNFINKSVTPTGTPDIDAAFLNYFQSIVDAQGDGLAIYSSDLETLEATVGALGTPFTDPMYISGLTVEYISTTQIRITSGACYIPAIGTIAQKTTDTTVTLSGLANNTWYYMYAANVSGTLAFDSPSTTAPTVYRGKAKQKSGDSTRRFVGSFKTNGSAQPWKFQRAGNWFRWLEQISVQFRVVNNGGSSARTTIDTSPHLPVGTTLALIQAQNIGGTEVRFTNSEANATGTADDWLHALRGDQYDIFEFPVDSNRQMQYRFSATTSGLYVQVAGFYEER